jgi:hypothetical protein
VELSNPDISENKQAQLLGLQKKEIDGNLRQTEARQLKKPAKTVQKSLKSLISAVRLLPLSEFAAVLRARDQRNHINGK